MLDSGWPINTSTDHNDIDDAVSEGHNIEPCLRTRRELPWRYIVCSLALICRAATISPASAAAAQATNNSSVAGCDKKYATTLLGSLHGSMPRQNGSNFASLSWSAMAGKNR